MIYRRDIRIEFNHCDPTGIGFSPRYFEMLNSVIGNFFRDLARYPFATMMREDTAVPTARLGRAALDLGIEARRADAPRLTAEITIVHVKAGRPLSWPEAVCARIARFTERPDEP